MTNPLWPDEYQSEVNLAVNSCLSEGIGVALSRLKGIEEKFLDHASFATRKTDLQQSILRNVILALTLSNSKNARLALIELMKEGSPLDTFEETERKQLIQTIEGKLTNTIWVD